MSDDGRHSGGIGPCEESTYREMFIHLLGAVEGEYRGKPVSRAFAETVVMLEGWHKKREESRFGSGPVRVEKRASVRGGALIEFPGPMLPPRGTDIPLIPFKGGTGMDGMDGMEVE